MALLFLELITPERVLFVGEIKAIMLPAADGDITVLPGYEPTITTLNPGLIVVTDKEGHGRTSFVAGGFVEINGSRVVILAHRALPIAELTAAHVNQEILHHETIRDSTPYPKSRQDAEFMISRLNQVRAAMSFSGVR